MFIEEICVGLLFIYTPTTFVSSKMILVFITKLPIIYMSSCIDLTSTRIADDFRIFITSWLKAESK